MSWASIGIQHVSVRCFESGPARATVTVEPTAYALLGHPSQYYIPGPIVLNPWGPGTGKTRLTKKEDQNHETSRSRPPDHDYGKSEAHPRLGGRRGHRRYHPCAYPKR